MLQSFIIVDIDGIYRLTYSFFEVYFPYNVMDTFPLKFFNFVWHMNLF
jgi:hypothetical protein